MSDKNVVIQPLTNEILKQFAGAGTPEYFAMGAWDTIAKTLTTANVPFRQNLSDLVTLAVQQRTPLRDRFRRVPAMGGAQVEWFTVSNVANLAQAAFGESSLPASAEPNYGINPPSGYGGYSIPPRRAIFKPIGYLITLTAQAQLVAANFHNQLAAAVEYAVIEVAQAEERMLLHGNSTNNPNTFDGLLALISTNTINKNGSPLTWNDILEAAQAIWDAGGQPKTIVCGYREARTLSNLYLSAVKPIEVGVVGAWGVTVKRVMTDFGELEIVMSQFLKPETRTLGGNQVLASDLLILDENHVTSGGGLAVGEAIEVHELLPMEAWVFPMQPLMNIGGSNFNLVTPVIVWEMVTLVVRAENWQAKIINIGPAS